MKNLYKLIGFIIVAGAINITAQDNSNARAVGMGFGSLTSSSGVDAYGLNPANYDYHMPLTLKKNTGKNKTNKLKSTFELSILSLGGGYGSNTSFDFYEKYTQFLTDNYTDLIGVFTNIDKTFDFKDNVLPDKESDVNFDFELKWLSLNFASPTAGAFNITISDKVGLATIVNSKDNFLNFTTTTNSNGTYDINNFRLEQKESSAWWIRKYTAGYGKQFDFKKGSVIKSISIGFSAAFVHGFGNISTSQLTLAGDSYGIRNVNGVNHVDSVTGGTQILIKSSATDLFRGYNDGQRTRFSFFPKPAGKGYSFDFGTAIQITDHFHVAASVIELGKITWDYNTFVSSDNNSFAYYNFDVTESDPTYQALLNDIKGTSSSDSNITYETDMPTKFRAGISFQPNEKLLIEFNWLNEKNNLPGKPVRNLYSLGGEVKPVAILPLRAGVTVNGEGEFNIAFGAGIKLLNFSFDLGVYGLNQLVIGKRFLAAFSTKLIF